MTKQTTKEKVWRDTYNTPMDGFICGIRGCMEYATKYNQDKLICRCDKHLTYE